MSLIKKSLMFVSLKLTPSLETFKLCVKLDVIAAGIKNSHFVLE